MVAELKAFGNMDLYDANFELRENLIAVKTQAEALLYIMDLIVRRINFESGEIDKWTQLRQALLDFRTLEVNPDIPHNVMISVENMDNLKRIYGTNTEASINRIINDLILEEDKRYREKLPKSKFQKGLEEIEPMN